MNLHLNQAKRKFYGDKITSLLSNDAVVFLKMMSALESCEYLVSRNNNRSREVGRQVRKSWKLVELNGPGHYASQVEYDFQNRDLDQFFTTVNTKNA